MSIVKLSKRGQVVIPKPMRDKLGLAEGMNLKAFLEDKRIVLMAEPETQAEELMIKAQPNVVKEAVEYYDKEEERNIELLLKDIGVRNGGSSGRYRSMGRVHK